MIKKTIYPKTERIKLDNHITITEKIDGSNLCFAKKNNHLLICQRSNIIALDEVEENKGVLYKGLYSWLQEHGKELESLLVENSVICGEWIGMGKLKYEFDNKFFMFAKANMNDNFEIYNLLYERELFIYPFSNQAIPEYISIVPFVASAAFVNINTLDNLYPSYVEQVGRNVEGFVINYGSGIIKKYVRMKNGKLEEHHG